MKNNIPAVFNEDARRKSLVTPETFAVAVGTSSTTLFPGRADEFFLLRDIVVANTTAGSLDLTINIGSLEAMSAFPVPANTTIDQLGIGGLLIAPGEALSAFGSAVGLNMFGWGVRVSGGDTWVL